MKFIEYNQTVLSNKSVLNIWVTTPWNHEGFVERKTHPIKNSKFAVQLLDSFNFGKIPFRAGLKVVVFSLVWVNGALHKNTDHQFDVEGPGPVLRPYTHNFIPNIDPDRLLNVQ